MSYIDRLIKNKDLEKLYAEKERLVGIIKFYKEELNILLQNNEPIKYIKNISWEIKNHKGLLKKIENAIKILEKFRLLSR